MNALINSPTAIPMAIWIIDAATSKTTVFICPASWLVSLPLVIWFAVNTPLSRPPVEASPPGTWVKMAGMSVAAATPCRSRE